MKSKSKMNFSSGGHHQSEPAKSPSPSVKDVKAPSEVKAPKNTWLQRNKEGFAICTVFVAILALLVTLLGNANASANERHHDEITLLQNELAKEQQALAKADQRVSELEALNQANLSECLNVVGPDKLGLREKVYSDYLRRELKRLEAPKQIGGR